MSLEPQDVSPEARIETLRARLENAHDPSARAHTLWIALFWCACATAPPPTPSPRPAPAPTPYWRVRNEGVPAARVAEIQRVLQKCARGLDSYVKSRPRPLEVIAYPDRAAFARGLQVELGFPSRLAQYFRRSSAPRPIRGKLLVPPDQLARNTCHELVHHVLESLIPRARLLQAKWFDEGSASLLAAMIIEPHKIRGQLGWFRSRHRYVPLYRMRTEQGWGELHRVQKLRSLAYLQAMDMVNSLLRQLGKDAYRAIVERAATRSVDEAFQQVTGQSVEAFFAGWLEQTRGSFEAQQLRDPVGDALLPGAEPEAVGLDPAAVRELVREATRSRSDTLLVIKDGKLVVERYFLDERGPIETMSVTKSIVSLAIGKLLAQGKIASLDAPMHTWLPEWKRDGRVKVTLRHILTHTSGIEHARADGKMTRQADRTGYARKRPLVDPPGQRFSYNNEAAQLLGEVVRQSAGVPLDLYMERELFRPLGIRELRWARDPAGNVQSYTGLALSARDLARLGLLMLDGGQRLLPKDWIQQSTAPGLPAFPQMGLLWWRRHRGFVGFNANGWQGQYLAVYPAWNLVAVRQRRPISFTEEENKRHGMWRFFDLVEQLVPAKSVHPRG